MRLFEGAAVQLHLPGARRVAGFLLCGLLAGCSGGNGNDAALGPEISTNAIAFSATGPNAETPAAQTFTATFGEEIAHLAVVHTGDAIASTSSTLNGRTAEITVVPTAPVTIGAGPFVGAIAVTGYTCADATCSRLAAGKTASVEVSYQISPEIRFVAPYVAAAGVSDSVLITGLGFGAFNISGVRFGDVAATSFTLSNTGREILATHPELAAGSYTVHLDASNHQGDVPSSVTLLVQDATAFTATTLAHVPSTTAVRSLVYDAEHQALLLVTDAPDSPIVRYTYQGGAWSAPTQAAGGYRDVALSADGRRLYAINDTALVPVDPVTLAAGTPVTAPSLAEGATLKNIVVGNDDRPFITTARAGNTSQGYLYDPTLALMLANGVTLYNATPAMAANGSGAVVMQSDSSLTSEVAVYLYSPVSSSLSSTSVALRQNAVPPAIDRSITRIVLNGTRVYDGGLAFFGTLPDTTAAVVLKPNGTRAYAYDPTAGGIVVYDISADNDEAAYTALGAATPLAGDPGSNVRMTITPDGNTLFLAGSTQIVVQPTPAL